MFEVNDRGCKEAKAAAKGLLRSLAGLDLIRGQSYREVERPVASLKPGA